MILGNGVDIGDAVDLVLDETGPEVHRGRPTVDVDTHPMGKSDDFRVAIEEGSPRFASGPPSSGSSPSNHRLDASMPLC